MLQYEKFANYLSIIMTKNLVKIILPQRIIKKQNVFLGKVKIYFFAK